MNGQVPEWVVQAQTGRVDRRCACGAIPKNGLICDNCRRSNEPDE
jgi:hypothetical protein